MMNFKKYIEITEGFEWAKSISKVLPNLALDLPVVEKTGIISLVQDKKNPILVQLTDGTKFLFTGEEFRRIKGFQEMKKGKKIKVVMQRRPEDKSKTPSQIISCEII